MANRQVIDPEKVRELAALGCAAGEIADLLGGRRRTIERRFGKLIRKTFAESKERLRRMQWEKADQKNVSMLIWLGRQFLGQGGRAVEPSEEAPGGFRVFLDLSREPDGE